LAPWCLLSTKKAVRCTLLRAH